ncbi:nucleotide-binding universal stress UspA family protein [Kibdelosporangium banguiense]|uniref:Nucleotide-binding universal stress UspA family protein n=1 Tax=Kibdelosporangium banguiense TaxID=1365924 RepID=A0ABS4TWJ8_9PSEU|nr:universal stress protein [Kibdelosporangium banguiense]MBP2328784.1 nucleotide-binding universal stress UspA family protein [Kibdelosporangium banguiense]
MSKPIVVGIDGRPDSAIALDWAIAEAARRGLRLTVLHVGEAWSRPVAGGPLMTAPQTHGQKVVADAAAVIQAMNRDIRFSSLIVPGTPADVLASWATDASMIVLGNRNRGALTTAALGSVSGTVASQARCPVVVVRSLASDQLPVLLGVDGSAVTTAAVEFAFDYASRHKTWVRAVHTWHRSMFPGGDDIAEERAAHFRIVSDALAAARDRHPTVPVRISRPVGRAEEVLSEQSMEAQLLVVGTRGHSPKAGLLLGSVSQALLRTVSCPLAVIPAEER